MSVESKESEEMEEKGREGLIRLISLDVVENEKSFAVEWVNTVARLLRRTVPVNEIVQRTTTRDFRKHNEEKRAI